MIAHLTEGKAGDMVPDPPEWSGAHALAEWLGVPVPALLDVPQFWLDRASVALEANAEVTRERRRRDQARTAG